RDVGTGWHGGILKAITPRTGDSLMAVPFQIFDMSFGKVPRLGNRHQSNLPEILGLIVLSESNKTILCFTDVNLLISFCLSLSHEKVEANIRQFRPLSCDLQMGTWHKHDRDRTAGNFSNLDAAWITIREKDLNSFRLHTDMETTSARRCLTRWR